RFTALKEAKVPEEDITYALIDPLYNITDLKNIENLMGVLAQDDGIQKVRDKIRAEFVGMEEE
ncbi:MAG: hypothetical protein GOV15_04025, partial [Candidatus Diapherotrites archaeon]|nr:hypothetical protein [Candidatus Diapherotrites archaeon]